MSMSVTMMTCAFLTFGSIGPLVIDVVRRSRSASRILGSVTADVHLHVRDVGVAASGVKHRVSVVRCLRSGQQDPNEPVVERSSSERIIRTGRNELDEAVVVSDTSFTRFSLEESLIELSAGRVQRSGCAVEWTT